jgi:hypothetical protein
MSRDCSHIFYAEVLREASKSFVIIRGSVGNYGPLTLVKQIMYQLNCWFEIVMENFFNVGDSNLIQSTLFPTHLKKLFKF